MKCLRNYLLGIVGLCMMWAPMSIYAQDEEVVLLPNEIAIAPHSFSFNESPLEIDADEEALAYPTCPEDLEAFLSSLEYKHFAYDDFILTTYITVSKKGKLKVDSVGVLGNYFDVKQLDKAFVAELTKKLPLLCDWVPVTVSNKKVASSQLLLILLSPAWPVFEDEDDVIEVIPYPELPVPTVPSNYEYQETVVKTEEPVFDVVEVMPQFPGGEEALVKYIKDNFKPTPDAIKYDIEGRMLISFVVNSDGSITDVKPLLPPSRQLGYGLEEAAVEMVKTMPAWIPGTQRGKKVSVRFTLPVLTFRE